MALFSAIFSTLWIVALVMAGFWLWMLIDVLSNQHDDKVVWLLVVLFLGPFGALLHYLVARKKRLATTS